MSQPTQIILVLHGRASGKKIPLSIPSELDPQLSLLDFLRMRNIPVASSCNGVGVCKKCVINKDLISCQITLEQVLQTPQILSQNLSHQDEDSKHYFIEIDYL